MALSLFSDPFGITDIDRAVSDCDAVALVMS
jgi:hypothetical protein